MTKDELENAQEVEMSRSEARQLIDNLDSSELLDALDKAQGDADEPGKTGFVIIRIAGSAI